MFKARTIVKKIAALTLMILSIFSTTQLQAATAGSNRSSWRVIAPQGSGFYVQMPGQPTKKFYKASTQYQYVEQTPQGNVFYGVAYEDYSTTPADRNGLLRAQCNAFANGFEGWVTGWTPIAKNGYQGVAARVENKNSSAIVAAWIVGRRCYCIAYATQKTQVLPVEARQFIDSLVLPRA